MSDRKLYMQYNEEENSLKDVTEEMEEEIAEVNETEEVVEDSAVEEEMNEESEAVEETKEENTLVGYVSGCTKLNIREEAYPGAKVLCTVPEKAVLLIDVSESTTEWYKIYTESGMEGYCMKKFVTVSE